MTEEFLYWFNNPAFRAGLFFVIGICFGSFMTAFTYRVPRRLNWTTERSRCTSCGHALGVPDLVPVFSWVALRGQCRHCGAKISPRYPLIELACGAAFAITSGLMH